MKVKKDEWSIFLSGMKIIDDLSFLTSNSIDEKGSQMKKDAKMYSEQNFFVVISYFRTYVISYTVETAYKVTDYKVNPDLR